MRKINPFIFRLWVVASLIWVSFVLYSSLPLRSGFLYTKQLAFAKDLGISEEFMPVECGPETQLIRFEEFNGETTEACFPNKDGLYKLWAEMDRRDTLKHSPHKRKELGRVVLKSAGAPLALVILLSALEWVLRGAGRSFIFVSGSSELTRPKTWGHAANQSTETPRAEKKGVGGWLLLFCVLLTIVFPLYAFSGYGRYMDIGQEAGFSNSPAIIALGTNALGSVFLGVYAFFIGLSIWRGSINGKTNARIFLVSYPLIALAYNSFALWQLGDGEVVGQLRVDFILDTVAKFLFSAVWLAYFWRSKRVKHTYAPTGQ